MIYKSLVGKDILITRYMEILYPYGKQTSILRIILLKTPDNEDLSSDDVPAETKVLN